MKPRVRPASSRRPAAPVAAVPSDVVPAIALNSAPTYTAFGYLLIVRMLLAYFKTLTLFVAALMFAVISWVKLYQRYPRTMFILTAFLPGLLGGRR